MSKQAWLTPPPLDAEMCIKLTLPADEVWLAAFKGALFLLCQEENWETGPDASALDPLTTATAWWSYWIDHWEPWSEGCDVANPVGQIFAWSGDAPPTGALACDGSEVAQSAYPELYAICGTLWGSAASGNFRLPDLASRVLVGVGTGSGLTARAVGDQGGQEAHTLVEGEIPPHVHALAAIHTQSNTTVGSTGQRYRDTAGGVAAGIATSSYGGAGTPAATVPHENMPPFTAGLICVWATP